MSDAQKKVALDIVNILEAEFSSLNHFSCDWNSDKALKLIAMLIPQAAAEADQEIDEVLADSVPPPGPSRFAALREAVHATEGMSIMCVIDAAVQKVQQLATCQALLAEACEAQMLVGTTCLYLPVSPEWKKRAASAVKGGAS